MRNVYIDIETIPAVDWAQARRLAHVESKVPGNYTKPDTISKWIAENGEGEFRKTALDSHHGWIACIGIAIGDDEPMIFDGVGPGNAHGVVPRALALEQEKACIRALSDALDGSVRFIGWNNAGFDMPWIYHSALRAGARKLPNLIVPPASKKYALPWLDLMDVWGCFQYGARARQRLVAEYLGILEPEPDLDGSQVYRQWLSGGDEYKRHCKSDIEVLREIHRKIGGGL